MKHTLAVTSAVVVVSTAVSAIVNLKDSCRSIYSWQEKGAFSRFLGSSPACVQSWDAEREMVPRRLRFSLELVENSPSLGCCELIRAHDWPISDKGSYHWINTLSVSARRHAYLASGWWLACCFKALHWRIRVLSSPSHHLTFDVANYTLTRVYVSRSLSKEKQSSQFVRFFLYLLTTTRNELDGEKFVEHVQNLLSQPFTLQRSGIKLHSKRNVTLKTFRPLLLSIFNTENKACSCFKSAFDFHYNLVNWIILGNQMT